MRAQEEVTALAARLVVDEGMEYGAAKRKAARELGGRIELPDNEQLEAAVREHIELFCADSQPAELQALREVALLWMQRLAEFRPHLSGAAWRGTATRLSAVHLDLYCDDPKAAEIMLINAGVDYDSGALDRPGRRESLNVLTLMLETLLTKSRFLEIYLNNVEWGEGVFGAQAAARHYFHVDAAKLGAEPAARLAVMLPAPKRFEKNPGSAYVAGRAATIVARMGAVELP